MLKRARHTPFDCSLGRGVLAAVLVAVFATFAVPNAFGQTTAQLRAQLDEANRQFTTQIRNTEETIRSFQTQIAAAERDKSTAEANLKSHNNVEGVVNNIINFLAPDDRRETYLNGLISSAQSRIDLLKSQRAAYQSALAGQRMQAASYNRALNLRIIKSDQDLTKAEAARRNAIVTGLSKDIETQKAQIDATQGIFEARVAEYDRLITERRSQGLGSVADQFEKDKQKTIEAHERWVASQNGSLRSLTSQRESFYQENRNDGIGYTNTGQVRTGIREAARARGETVTDETADRALVDQTSVASSVESANKVATGAPRNVDHVSIFNGITGESVNDFLLDLKEDKLTWYEFSLRFGAYSKGVARGTWDALKDLLKLVKAAGETGGEAVETALRAYGIDSNRFGRENLEKLEEISRNAAILFDPNNPEGDKMAADLVRLADRVVTQAQRSVEQTAASGDDKKALESVGYGTATVLGGEDIAFRLFGSAFKIGIKGVDAVSDAVTARRAVTGAAGTADTVGDASRAAGAAGDAGRVATGTERAAGAATDAEKAAAAAADAERAAGPVTSCPAPRTPGLFSRARSRAARASNMAPGHADQFADVARRRDEVIMVRPVNPHSTNLIERDFATKGMNIKGKSADLGEHAGTIPVDPRYSKLGNADTPPTPETLRQYENYNKKALGEPYETPIKDAEGNITGWESHEAVAPVAKSVPATRADGSVINGADGNPIMVLADPTTGRPITADYDLFAVGSKNGPGEVGAFDPDLGSISANERGTMLALNDGAKDAGYAGGNVVHHGPANRFANTLEAADWPVTAFTPDGNIHTITGVEDLNDFYATWRAAGYKLEAMEGWGLDPNFVPTGKFAPVTGPRAAQHAAALGFLGAAKACGDDETQTADESNGSGESTSGETTGGRPKTGSGAAAGDNGGTQVSLGGFDGIPVMPFMNIGFGPMMPYPTGEDPRTSLPPGDSETGVAVDGGDMVLVDFFARTGFIPFSETEIRTMFAGGVPAGGPPYVKLDFNTGGKFKAGEFISLSRVTGGTFANNEPGCMTNGKYAEHLHGTIDIDGMGPFADPNPTKCGHGKIIR